MKRPPVFDNPSSIRPQVEACTVVVVVTLRAIVITPPLIWDRLVPQGSINSPTTETKLVLVNGGFPARRSVGDPLCLRLCGQVQGYVRR